MGYNPLVSIITVCYNSEKNIRDTIESVLNQSYDNIEYVIVDGGSTDNTINIIKEYEPSFKEKMRWVSEPDEGIYDAMNKGIDLANGEIIGIINSDDWYEICAVEKVVDKFKESDADVVYGDLYKVIPETSERYIRTGDLSHKKISKIRLNHPTLFVKKGIYDKLGVFNTNYPVSADLDLIIRFLYHDVSFVRVPAALANFRLGGISSEKSIIFQLHRLSRKYKILRNNKVPYHETIYLISTTLMSSLRDYFILKVFGRNFFNRLRNIRYNIFNPP
ncbi:glycosyltransferase family 2 protein [Methanohalophilus mahii]|uniref:Glycosyl transferase family 2 n=1 Tax=Methanohalophilus mahii (strain ATCC 35705 / DSM 5219 / SLP) TaxID=547558 RepID=D5E8W7_METMS|nr:glycosyltransferase family 2 protein [Methanohalophilus mahii]ADE35626.1 glycosyl transferase family 2 [Methanohalophilus mahii DSM 5219]